MEAHFSIPELQRVLARYELGEARHIRELRGGTRASAKAVIECARGTFLLKRFEASDADPTRLVFRHTLMLAARAAGVRVPELIGTRGDNNSMLQLEERVYELVRYVEGRGFAHGSSASSDASAAGRTLAVFHTATRAVSAPPQRLRGADAFKGKPPAGIANVVAEAWREAATRREAGPRRAIHGDVHPGNTIYDADGRAWLLDFDAAHEGVASDDLAQGAGQFAWAADRNDPGGELDVLAAFWRGYAEAGGPADIPPQDAPSRIAGALALEVARAHDAQHSADEATRMGQAGEARVAGLLAKRDELVQRLRAIARTP